MPGPVGFSCGLSAPCSFCSGFWPDDGSGMEDSSGALDCTLLGPPEATPACSAGTVFKVLDFGRLLFGSVPDVVGAVVVEEG